MNCDAAIDLIIDSLMDGLDEEQSRILEEHVRSCPRCEGEREKLGRMWESLARIPLPDSSQAGQAAALEFGRLLEARTHRWKHVALLAAASVAFLLIGGAAGYRMAQPGAEPAVPGEIAASAEFLLLMRGDLPAASEIPMDRLVTEYSAWGAELGAAGRLVAAEKLVDDPGRWLQSADVTDGTTAPRGSDIGGYFVIRATTYDQAQEIALSSPHIRYGGTIELRQIEQFP